MCPRGRSGHLRRGPRKGHVVAMESLFLVNCCVFSTRRGQRGVLTNFRYFLEYSSSPCGLSVDAARFPLAIPGFSMYSSAWMAGTRWVGGQFATVMSKSMSERGFGWCPLTRLDFLGNLASPVLLCLECDLCGIVSR